MSISKAKASWQGALKTGRGTMRPAHGEELPFSLTTRFEGAKGSNPEELIGAALAGCFSMALAAALGKAGSEPTSIDTDATVHLDKEGEGFRIAKIELSTVVAATGVAAADFERIAKQTKETCPVSKALAGTTIELAARLM